MKSNVLVLLRGISGAGKTTFTEMLRKHVPHLVHCSADFVHLNENKEYVFDPKKLGEGHGNCFRETIHAIQEGAKCVVVDNTSTTLLELAPYIAAGQAFNCHTVIVKLEVPEEVAHARNVHGVPREAVSRMAQKMASKYEQPFKRWPREYKFSNPTEAQVERFYSEVVCRESRPLQGKDLEWAKNVAAGYEAGDPKYEPVKGKE